MGWKRRDWFLGPHQPVLFDTYGNIGPTVWWDGRIVGGWAVTPAGQIAFRLLEDIGHDGQVAVEKAAGIGSGFSVVTTRVRSFGVARPSFSSPKT